jgi:hypothetical protein
MEHYSHSWLAAARNQISKRARSESREHGAQQQLLNKKQNRKWLSARRFEMSAEEVTVWKIELSVVDPFIISKQCATPTLSQCALPTVFSSATRMCINTVAIMRKFDAKREYDAKCELATKQIATPALEQTTHMYTVAHF